MPPSTSDAPLAGRRILVVEDVYFVADDIAAALRGAGAIVVGPAPNGPAALSLMASERLDAAVLDINLHDEAVYPVAEALRARGTPFVFATGYDRCSIPAAYRGVPLWEKPFDSAALIRSLPALIDIAGGHRDRPTA